MPAALDTVVLRAMAKRPEDRFASAAAFAEAIGAAVDAPAAGSAEPEAEATMVSPRRGAPARGTAPPAATPVAAMPPPRRPLGAILGGVVALLLLAGGGTWWFVLRPSGEVRVITQAPAPVTTLPAPTPPVTVAPVTSPPLAASPAASAGPTAAPTPPAAMPAAPAAPAQPAAPTAAATQQQVAAALATTGCVLAHATTTTDGDVAVTGFAGDDVAAGLRARLAALAGPTALTWQVQGLNPVFCAAMTVLRPVAPPAGAPALGLGLRLAGGLTALHDGARILPRVTMPQFAGYLRVDYLGHDGSVVHLYPSAADPSQHFVAVPARRLAPGTVLRLGDGGPGRPLWEVGPPYGTDMIVAIASAQPLLPADPPANIDVSAAAYLHRLGTAIAAARAGGEQVTATVLPVDTLPAAK